MRAPVRRRLSWRTTGSLVIACVLGLGLVLAWWSARPEHADARPPAADPSVPGVPVTTGDADCGTGWSGGTAGRQQFAVWNNSINPVEVYLQDVATGKVYLDVENLGTGATRAAQVVLGPGRYEFVCLPAEATPLHGAPQLVTGTAPGRVTPGVVPVTANDLAPAVARYQRWVLAQLPALLTRVRALAAAAAGGDLATAKRDWLDAHLIYERLGAAYGAFGADDTAIDAEPAATGDPATDRHLHGFHRIEAMLWTGRTGGLVRETEALVAAVRHLREDLAGGAVIAPIDVGLRAHEILEDAVGQVLTGYDDAGSHSGLATIDANLDGTWGALRPLLPLLRSRDPQLAATQRWLRRDRRLLAGYRHGGTWTRLDRLSRGEREHLDAALGQTVELLSRVAVITDPRRGAR